ncbi:MAG: PspC domain-containing protein [Burkholderiales bacterium]|nr:PspC domain-containing protein [Burkholderiales bacterium]
MYIADEIEKLSRLREQGALTEEEFSRAKTRLLDGPRADNRAAHASLIGPLHEFFRSKSDHWLGGVCGGLAELTNVPSWLWRLLFSLFALCGGVGLVIYILMWLFVPERPASATPT